MGRVEFHLSVCVSKSRPGEASFYSHLGNVASVPGSVLILSKQFNFQICLKRLHMRFLELLYFASIVGQPNRCLALTHTVFTVRDPACWRGCWSAPSEPPGPLRYRDRDRTGAEGLTWVGNKIQHFHSQPTAQQWSHNLPKGLQENSPTALDHRLRAGGMQIAAAGGESNLPI